MSDQRDRELAREVWESLSIHDKPERPCKSIDYGAACIARNTKDTLLHWMAFADNRKKGVKAGVDPGPYNEGWNAALEYMIDFMRDEFDKEPQP